MDEFELEIKQDFLEESTDLLDAAESAFLRLENERDNDSLFDEIFRLAHNLKGTSKAVGFDQFAEITHIAESLILKLKDKELLVSDQVVNVLLSFKDKIDEMVSGLKENIEAEFEVSKLQGELESLISGETVIPDSSEKEIKDEPASGDFEDLDFDSTESAVETSEEVVTLNENVSNINERILQNTSEEAVSTDSEINENNKTKKVTAVKNSDGEESVRVKLARIDKINNVIGELVILQTVLSQRRFEFITDDLSNKSIGMMSKLFKEVQEISMSLRMLPLKSTFQKMNRIVRDTSRMLDKEVNLNIIGEDTEVDKTVLEKLADPLVHIIRNAVDHGLESRLDRAESGKEGKGNVELMAYHEGSNLVIQVTDDGKGINPEVIRKKAIEKKIISESDRITDQNLIELIFHPGLSTKEEVTEVSGRGVGMDVVKTNIEELGGELKLMSKLGQGSSIKIILPLTLAIIEGIIIKSCENSFVVPLSQVYEISQIKSSDVESFSGVANLFKLRGEILPLFFVNNKLGNPVNERDAYTVIVIRGLDYAFGVVVDDILTQQQVVIKKLGSDVQGKKGIIGSAIMSDGMPSLILDIFDLFRDDLKQSRAFKKFKDRSLDAA